MVASRQHRDSISFLKVSISRGQNLQEFVNFCQQYISGKERSQAQIFLDRFFQAFGHQGALQAGAESPIDQS